jgi:integrase
MTDMRVNLPHLQEKKRRGRFITIVRRGKTPNQTEREIQLHQKPGTPEFLAEYQWAVNTLYPRAGFDAGPRPGKRDERPRPLAFPDGTFGDLVRRYFTESIEFKRMKPRGQARRRTILMSVVEKMGAKPAIIPKENIAAGFAKRSEKPEAANAYLKALKALYGWARSVDAVAVNPAKEIKKIRRKTTGYHTWSLSELRAYTTKHPRGTMAYLALALMLLHGLRREDASIFGRQHISDGRIRFVTGKTESEFTAFVSPLFLDAVEAAPRHEHLTFLVNGWGRPFASGNAFGNWFKDRCVEAGISHCTAHGVRKAGASIARENGASDGQLDAMFTWADPDQRGTYTTGADHAKLATAGFKILEKALIAEKVLAPLPIQAANDFGVQAGGVKKRTPKRASKPMKRKG